MHQDVLQAHSASVGSNLSLDAIATDCASVAHCVVCWICLDGPQCVAVPHVWRSPTQPRLGRWGMIGVQVRRRRRQRQQLQRRQTGVQEVQPQQRRVYQLLARGEKCSTDQMKEWFVWRVGAREEIRSGAVGLLCAKLGAERREPQHGANQPPQAAKAQAEAGAEQMELQRLRNGQQQLVQSHAAALASGAARHSAALAQARDEEEGHVEMKV